MLIVNGEPVDPELIENAFLRIKGGAESISNESCCAQDDEFLLRAREEVIQTTLLAQEIDRRTYKISTEIVQERLLATLRGLREKGFSKELIENNRAAIESDIRTELRTATFMTEIDATLPSPNDADINAYYDAHPDKFRTPEQAHLLHCMKSLVGVDNPLPLYEELRRMRQDVLNGGDFASLAANITAKPNREIDLGWVNFERPDNPFEIMAFSLQINEISPVFLYERCLHLVIPINRIEPTQTPRDEAADSIKQELILRNRTAAINSLTTKLREQALIEES